MRRSALFFREVEVDLVRILALCIALCCPILAQTGQAPIVPNPPSGVSIPSIIQSFAAKEKDLKQALGQYSYTREILLRASCPGAQTGLYHLVVDVGFDARGNRVEKARNVDSTLQCIQITEEDLETFRNQALFVLTPEEIQNYQINFVGQQHQKDLNFYVFDVSPLAGQLGKQYFEGRIWVDAHDSLIIKSHGTIVTKREKKAKEQNSSLPAVTIWRAQIDGRYWFPTQGIARDVLHFPTGDVQVDEIFKLTDYKAIKHPQ